MTNRKKRLKKGIESLQEQIELHKEKKKHAEEEGDEDLTIAKDVSISPYLA